ncbi:MAG: DUF3501 family protein [Gammaproteobacteria bacterium]|nr:MAG: DUF3501 family protein [Gammaproteobacteria bacterium]
MSTLTRSDLMSLEEYSGARTEYRARVMAHKKNRKVLLGEHAALYFEDRLTMQYQIQEMLRIEKIFDADGIQEELDTYNPLIPDGSNLKATFMMEYPDIEERTVALARLVGIEDRVWVQIEGCDRVYAIADEDLERETEEKTSAVHFLRFEFTPDMISLLKGGAALVMGIDHENYSASLQPVGEPIRESLLTDFAA